MCPIHQYFSRVRTTALWKITSLKMPPYNHPLEICPTRTITSRTTTPQENYPWTITLYKSPWTTTPGKLCYFMINEAFRNIAFITSSSLNQGNHIKKLNLFDGYKCEQAPQAFSRNSIRTFHKILGKIAVFSTFLESQINFGIYTEWIFGEMLQKNPIISNHLISLTYVDHYKS